MSNAISLQASFLSVTVLNIFTDDIQQVKYDLNETVEQDPTLYLGKTVVIEPKIELEDPTFLALLVEFLYQLEMIPAGIRTQDESIQMQAEYAGLAILAETDEQSLSQTLAQTISQPKNQNKSALRVKNVRSGQQVYAEGRDLIVMGSVNPGAEVIADGNVHIYGKINGKVFAGASGLKDARIYANNLNPEMLTIAGLYQLSEDIEDIYKQGFVEVSLNAEDNFIEYRRVLCPE
jgi:septum site-determining protein MinC